MSDREPSRRDEDMPAPNLFTQVFGCLGFVVVVLLIRGLISLLLFG